jgi:hypothetical protein
MHDKVLLSVKLPATGGLYEFRVPFDLTVDQAVRLISQVLGRRSLRVTIRPVRWISCFWMKGAQVVSSTQMRQCAPLWSKVRLRTGATSPSCRGGGMASGRSNAGELRVDCMVVRGFPTMAIIVLVSVFVIVFAGGLLVGHIVPRRNERQRAPAHRAVERLSCGSD